MLLLAHIPFFKALLKYNLIGTIVLSKKGDVTICFENLVIIVVGNLIGSSLIEVVLYDKFKIYKIYFTNNSF